jgi:hypothetical protein
LALQSLTLKFGAPNKKKFNFHFLKKKHDLILVPKFGTKVWSAKQKERKKEKSFKNAALFQLQTLGIPKFKRKKSSKMRPDFHSKHLTL